MGYIRPSSRLEAIPPYLFSELDARRDQVSKMGMDIIDLGVGDPDLPAPKAVAEAAAKAVLDPASHSYPPYEGTSDLKKAIARYYKERFNVILDPDAEVLVLGGSKEGIAHLATALVDHDDVVLVPDPAYPVYEVWAKFCGGRVVHMPLLEKNGFFPDLSLLDKETCSKAKLLWLCYPNNPTTATASAADFKEALDFASRHNLVAANDNAYAEIQFKHSPTSILSLPDAKENAIEFGSFSKTFDMCGFRLGWAVGNHEVLDALKAVKKNTDSGVFTAVQEAGRIALEEHMDFANSLRVTYKERRDAIITEIAQAGLDFRIPDATFFIWIRVPAGMSSSEFSLRLLEETGVVVTPGNGFGPYGEGFFRISLTRDKKRLAEAGRKIRGFVRKITN
ncbi:MAG: aminotransferase class I/II-fold pyridoxal phosphate-dependent enzyme [Deltaproteobacteria bacterium]|nr:aminotransferase class I/II-fold pyridoxal phosphate-dependent enzyme [Deltaproteobacteria bacterium]